MTVVPVGTSRREPSGRTTLMDAASTGDITDLLEK
jgi:hypothetical protein